MKRAGRLEITTRIGCKCNCVYCPQSLLLENYYAREKGKKAENIMSLDTFKTCVDKLPEGTRVDFSGMAEPWLNTECTDMVLYAHEKGFPIAVYTTLVGMNQEHFNKIKDIPFEEFVLHIPDDKSNANIQVTDEYVSLLERVAVYRQKDGKRLVTGVSCHAGIHPAIKEMIPEDSKMITELHDRAGNVDNEYVDTKENHGKIVCINCESDIHHNVLLPDGTVLLCCMDYGMKHILGNLLVQSYEEIYQSEEATKIRSGMEDDTFDILCRKCVNARNIGEMYEEYYGYKEWVKSLLVLDEQKQRELERVLIQYNQRVKEIEEYRTWVDRLEKRGEESKRELERITAQYAQRVDELKDYKQWIENFEIRDKERLSELSEKQLQISELEKSNQIIKDNLAEITKQKKVYEDEMESLKKNPFYKLLVKTNIRK